MMEETENSEKMMEEENVEDDGRKDADESELRDFGITNNDAKQPDVLNVVDKWVKETSKVRPDGN